MSDSVLWNELADTWQAADDVGPRLDEVRARVDRESVALRWLVRTEIAVTVVMVGGFLLSLGALPRSERWAWLAAVLGHTVVVLVFAIWNRRGIWRPLGSSTRDYLRLAAERCRRRLRTARFVALVLGIEAAAFVALLWTRDSLDWRTAGGAAVVVALVWWIGEWDRRRTRARLARVLALSDAMALESDA